MMFNQVQRWKERSQKTKFWMAHKVTMHSMPNMTKGLIWGIKWNSIKFWTNYPVLRTFHPKNQFPPDPPRFISLSRVCRCQLQQVVLFVSPNSLSRFAETCDACQIYSVECNRITLIHIPISKRDRRTVALTEALTDRRAHGHAEGSTHWQMH